MCNSGPTRTATARTADPALNQLGLDSRAVLTYRQHQRETYRVSQNGPASCANIHAGPLAYPDILTLTPPTATDQSPNPTMTPSSPTTTAPPSDNETLNSKP
ncbi:hypothetical protein MLP_18770 [Microlunatus phosphovorus NM-1]|uniref:Uncharacterized protein n=1 Tax=Microlunatus phosphovorus (strain ATCC 700054 / DSM 10555 / JCM 9379 / NBRC 101784 / NCIMB 13414 / VKM Ac-1990 / NM-1) TaxID=1032480 RepID=F5XT19_MICPN|nr:hypothetical protein MLP_18770 [Microlunatus phosphovorus NM-1]